jgi:hypothetical protein
LRFAAILPWLARIARLRLTSLIGCLWLLRQLLRGILRARQRRQRQRAAGQIRESYAGNHPQPNRHQAQRHQSQDILPRRTLTPRDPAVQQLGGM